MGKRSGTALAVIALILSIGFGGYFILDKFVLTPAATSPSTPPTNQYFKERSKYQMIPSAEE